VEKKLILETRQERKTHETRNLVLVEPKLLIPNDSLLLKLGWTKA